MNRFSEINPLGTNPMSMEEGIINSYIHHDVVDDVDNVDNATTTINDTDFKINSMSHDLSLIHI